MGIAIFVENQNHRRIGSLFDDMHETFMRFCESGDRGSMRRGIARHGDTMLNEFQLLFLIQEIDALDREEKLPTLRAIIEGAYLARRHFGYLYFVGD